MDTVRAIGVLAATATVVASLVGAPAAHGEDWGVDISGTWSVYSDGEWAKTNEVFIDQRSVQQTWTVDVNCVSPIECSGTVKSSLGWTGQARLEDYWFIEHEVPNWMPCPDGTFATGYQKFLMWGWDSTIERRITRFMSTMAGRNVTLSDSGACGVNNPKVIELPVWAEKLA
ncbi:hypothetical protein ACAG25_02360 [Mycobacterium sp. pV006]|uniref:hypothetical protein n=1 Tax=Mycobacterium sp. pV006 TaxID=3238983 RepID=UPI00351B9F88